MTAQYSVLGPVRVRHDGAPAHPCPPQQRALLALLLLRAGEPVPMHDIARVLWPSAAPPSAANIVHRYVSLLRRVVDDGTLTRSASGYQLDARPGSLDLHRFHRLVDQARAAEATDPDRAGELLTEAIRLRGGPVAADLPETIRHAPVFVEAERRVAAALVRAAGVVTGRPRAADLLPVLRDIAAAAPLDEAAHAALIRLLAAAGRAAEATEVFTALRARLAEELGVDPSPEVVAAHRDLRPPRPAPPAGPGRPAVLPAQLPLDLATFASRTDQVERLTGHLLGERRGTDGTRVAVVVGMGGIGKTSLAVHCAHLVAGHFPDGQLYANLRGFDPSGTPVPADDVVRGFLTALGVPEADIPANFEGRLRLYRSVSAGRRLLVLLDNVRDVEQARPLLPGGPDCAVIVTSRDPLVGLIVREAAVPVPLDPMSNSEAGALLERRLGGRLAAEPDIARRVIAACGGLPLALAIFGARAVAHSHFSLRQLLAELEASRDRLDAFGRFDGAHDVRAVFSWSYRLLGPDAARLFRLLSLHPGQVFGAAATASLAGRDVAYAAGLLAELQRANLITETAPSLFRMHDLVAAYSARLLADTDPDGVGEAARARLLDHYVQSALLAAARINGVRSPGRVAPAPMLAGVAPQEFASYRDAVRWFERERTALLKTIESAAAAGRYPPVWQVAWAMENYLQRHHYWAEWEQTQKLAQQAARQAGDVRAEARAQHSLGMVYSGRALNLPERARAHLHEAIRLSGECGDVEVQAQSLLRLSGVEDPREADRRRHIERALELYKQLASAGTGAIPFITTNIAHGYMELGRYAEALPYALRGAELLQRSGDPHGTAVALSNVGEIRARLGDLTGARAADERAVAAFLDAGDEYVAATQLEDMGHRYASRAALERALAIYETLGSNRAARVRGAIAAQSR